MEPVVSLVGAGPGHPDLLTLKGLRRIESAEVVLYDALLDESFQELFPVGATAISVGKRCGRHAVPQEDICAMLVAFGRQGRRTVRLKGGDPLLFGRGGEEILALTAAGVPCEIVPGVSSLNGAGGGAGIPLTHRGIGDRVLVVNAPSLLRDPVDGLARLLDGGLTLVVFMGGRLRVELAALLLSHGACPDLPVSLVESGCTRAEKVLSGSLQDLAEGRLSEGSNGPVILYAGWATMALKSAHEFVVTDYRNVCYEVEPSACGGVYVGQS